MTYIPPLENLVSTDNSTTSPLGASAVFTGTGEATGEYSTLTINCFTDQSGTLEVQFSSDGVNFDISESFDIETSTAFARTVNIEAAYYRVVLTNDAVAQTVLRLQTILNTNKAQDPDAPLPFEGLTQLVRQSTDNSSTTPLGSSATFTGIGNTSKYNTVLVSVASDAPGTAFIDYSPDNIVWTPSGITGYRIEANRKAVFKEDLKGIYFRVRLVNGTTAQTSLDLITLTGTFDDEYNNTYSQIIRKNLGLVQDVAQLTKVSYQANLTTTYQDIWGSTGAMVLPTGAESYEIVSSNANDTSAGTGARTVFVETLNASGEVQSQVVTLNGTTAVALTGTHTFPRSMILASAGSGRENVGTITLRVAGGGNIRSVILPTEGVALDSLYQVPSNIEFHITDLDYHTGDASKKITVRSRILLPGTNAWLSTSVLPFSQQSFTRNFDETSARFPSGTIIKYDGRTSTGSGDDVAIILSGLEVRVS